METSRDIPPESVVRALAKSGAQNIAKATGELLRWADSGTDRAVAERSVDLMRIGIRTFKRALPDTDPELIGGFFANLLDIWETGQKLEKGLEKLKKLRLPRDQEALREVLIWINAIQVDMASYWIGEVKREVPKLLRALDKKERKTIGRKQKNRPNLGTRKKN